MIWSWFSLTLNLSSQACETNTDISDSIIYSSYIIANVDNNICGNFSVLEDSTPLLHW